MSAAHRRVGVPKILLADDHPAVLRTLSAMLAPHFDITAAVSNGKAALDAAVRTDPDLVVLDIAMPELDGIRTARELKEKKLRAKVLFLTAQDDDDYISEALDAGARGYVVKRRMQTDLMPGLGLALAGHYFISPYSFEGSSTKAPSSHTLTFYVDETIFFQKAAELTHTALAKGDPVSMFLSKEGLHYVREQLRAWGLNYSEAIERGQYQVYSVEEIMPSLTTGKYASLARFKEFFGYFLNRAAACARKRGVKPTVISDMTALLLRHGYGQQVAAHVEEIWNGIIPRHSCVIYCGCPLRDLGSKEKRSTLSQICGEHSNVIPIDR